MRPFYFWEGREQVSIDITGFERRRRELAAAEAAQAASVEKIADAMSNAVVEALAEQAEPKVKPFADMTKKELLAYAAENGIDLGAAKTNAEMIAAIEKHEKG